MENLLPEEEVIVSSDDQRVMLTDRRIIVQKKFANSIVFLEEVNSIEVSFYGDLYCLLLSVFFSITFEQQVWPAESNSLLIITQIISSAVLIILWWIFHRAVIIVALKGGKKTEILISQRAYSKIPGFVNAIQLQREKRVKSLMSDQPPL